MTSAKSIEENFIRKLRRVVRQAPYYTNDMGLTDELVQYGAHALRSRYDEAGGDPETRNKMIRQYMHVQAFRYLACQMGAFNHWDISGWILTFQILIMSGKSWGDALRQTDTLYYEITEKYPYKPNEAW